MGISIWDPVRLHPRFIEDDKFTNMKEKDNWIETYTGKDFHIFKSDFDIIDIAASLGKLCRFNGQCLNFYSVASHSILVADIMLHLKYGNPLEGLLHDGTEAYLADIPSPFKSLLPEYKSLEKILDSRLRKQFGLPEECTSSCKMADAMALFIEADHLMFSGGKNWIDPLNLREEALSYEKQFGLPWVFDVEPKMASELFLSKYAKLKTLS